MRWLRSGRPRGLIGEELELLQESTEEDLRTSIYLNKIETAELEEDKMETQVSMIDDQRRNLAMETAAGSLSRIAANPTPCGVASGTISGVIEAGVTYDARRNELRHQLDMARLDVDIAHTSVAHDKPAPCAPCSERSPADGRSP
jgi:hypothetical protein